MTAPNKTERLTTTQVALELRITPSEVRHRIRAGLLQASKVGGRWMIERENLELFKEKSVGIKKQKFIVKDTGLLQVSSGLTVASSAIMALIPGSETNQAVENLIHFFALIIGLLSLYTSLWFLGEYVEDIGLVEITKYEDSSIGWGHIYTLFISPEAGPYRFLAITLTALVVGLTIASVALIRS